MNYANIPVNLRGCQILPLPEECGKHELLRTKRCADMREEDRLLAWVKRTAAADTLEAITRQTAKVWS